MTFKKILASAVAAVLAVSSMAVFTSAVDTFKAGVTFQTQSWSFRDDLDQDAMGIDGAVDEDGEYEDYEFKDVDVTKDGTYTVSVSGIPENGSLFNIIKLATTVPCTTDDDGNVKSDVTIEVTGVKVDGSAVALDATKATVDNDKQKLSITLMNEWNDDMKGNGAIANGAYTAIEITFTVSGMGGAAAPATDENPAGNTNQATDDKNSPDTGVEGVAVVAGLAVIAAGAVVVSKKRK